MTDETKNPSNHLRAWREHRHLTQDQLAEMVGTTGAVIHLIETAQRGLSHKWLMRLAGPLQTTPGMILDHLPEDAKTELQLVYDRATDEDRQRLLKVAEAMIPYKAQPRN